MLEEYQSIEQIVQADRLLDIQTELNSSPQYCEAVRYFKLRRIGIIVKQGRRTVGEYMSYNDESGYVTKMVDCFDKAPDVIATTQDKHLITILHDVDWVKQHPWRSIAKYGPKFRIKNVTKKIGLIKIMSYAAKRLSQSL